MKLSLSKVYCDCEQLHVCIGRVKPVGAMNELVGGFSISHKVKGRCYLFGVCVGYDILLCGHTEWGMSGHVDVGGVISSFRHLFMSHCR